MNKKKLNPLDKSRRAAHSNLKEVKIQPALKASAHRGPNKRFNHPNIARGALLAKQSRPLRKDFSFPRTSEEVLDELAQIRQLKNELKKKK